MIRQPYFRVIPNDLFSKSEAKGRAGTIIQFPLVRMLLALLFLLPVLGFNAITVLGVIDNLPEPAATMVDFARMAATIPLVFLAYSLYCRWVENREALEMGLQGGGRQWVAGVLLAAGLISLFVGVIAIFASFEIIEYRPLLTLVKNALLFSMGALIQDVILLCILFRLAEELAGTWIAIVLCLLIFGFVHLFNPNQDLGSVMFLVFSSVVIIAPFILTRQIWLSWGVHAGWNFTQAGVFGMANSGIMFPGWMVSQVSGPDWLTGGAVGLEGSYMALAADLVIGIAMLVLAVKWGRLVKPASKRRD